MRFLASGTIIVFVGFVNVSVSQASDWDDCESYGDDDVIIRGCSGVIKRGKRKKPDIATAHYKRGKTYLSRNKFDKAISDFTRVIKMNVKDAFGLTNTTFAYWRRGDAYAGKKDYDKAISDYTKAIELDPKDDTYFISRAEAYAKKNEHDLVLADYKKALRINPNSFHAYMARGMYFVNNVNGKREYGRAVQDLTKAYEINTKEVWLLTFLGRAHVLNKNYDSAIAVLKKAIEIEPKKATFYFNFGLAYTMMGRRDDSIAMYSKALELNPKYVDARINRGILYRKKGDYDRSISDFNHLAKRFADNAIPYYHRGLAYAKLGKRNLANADFKTIAKVSPESSLAYLGRGELHLDAGEAEKAMVAFEHAIELDPKNPRAYTFRGQVHERKDQSDKAMADYRKALELSPDNEDAKRALEKLMAQPSPSVVSDSDKNSDAETTKTGKTPEIFKHLDLFGDVLERVREDYVEKPDDRALIEAAINGMLTSLDPHSSYLSPKRFRDMQVQTRGDVGGLGLEVTMEKGVVKVVAPIDDTPAHKAGVLANDLITHIDGDSLNGLSLEQSVKKMRGPVKSPIKLTIVRKDHEKPFEVTVVRDIIRLSSVKTRPEGDIGYIRLTTFNEEAHEKLIQGVDKLKRQIGNDRIRGYILDLRNNPGGLLDQAIAVADDFLERGTIVLTRGRDSKEAQRAMAKPGDITAGKKLVVLVNGGSAAASEIVAGALQDHKRATLLGTRTFGKGTIQTIIPLGANGAIRLTTARYYTPSNRSIQAKGIDPDIVLANSSPNGSNDGSSFVPKNPKADKQLQRALSLFKDNATSKTQQAGEGSTPVGDSSTTDKEVELAFWETVRDSGDPALFELYLKRYPNGVFADLARMMGKKAK